jgi:hypothetical protein
VLGSGRRKQGMHANFGGESLEKPRRRENNIENDRCITSAFGVEPRRMLSVIRFGKHCSSHLQCECVVVGRIWQPYIGQAVGGDLLNIRRGKTPKAEVIH